MFLQLGGKWMNYKKAIYKMIEAIEDEAALKRIFNFVHRIFIRRAGK